MQINDLRSFVETLRGGGQLHDIKVEVDPSHELGAVLRACEQDGRAAFFHNVKGHNVPVVGGALGSHERIALALGCSRDQLRDVVGAATSSPMSPKVVDDGAPSQEVVCEAVDLSTLPVPVHAPNDAGPYINAGVVIARDPQSGRHNLSFVRMQVFGRNKTGVNINLWRHMKDFHDKAEAEDQNLPFCVAIGVDPALMMAAAFRYEGDEYEIAGALRGEPVPLVRARTCDVLVPAFAEFILECEVVAGERITEGPMAEYTGHYSGTTEQPVGIVNAITHRSEPIFQTIAGASFEHLILGNALTREPYLEAVTRRLSNRVQDVHLPPYGSGFMALVALDSPRAGDARNVALAAFNSHVNVKTVIALDSDVDLFNPSEVLWAIATRVRWDRDIVVIPDALGNELDPSANDQGVLTKMIIDATLGSDRTRTYKKVTYPSVDLQSYLE
jgi:2,5-furandicarboxylate decarboxylase 1